MTIQTLKVFLKDGEYENLINFAPLIKKTLIYFTDAKGVVHVSIQEGKPIVRHGIPIVFIRSRRESGALSGITITDPVSGQALSTSEYSGRPKAIEALDELLKKAGVDVFTKAIKRASSITQDAQAEVFMKQLETDNEVST